MEGKLMNQRRTLNSLAFPEDLNQGNLPVEWAASVSDQILNWTWLSFERLEVARLANIDFTIPIEQLERALTQLHCIELQLVMAEQTDGYCSFVAIHECDEFEKLKTAKSKPPANDIGLVHRNHRRWIWPIEAKVVPTPGTLHEYLDDVEKFIDGRAGPLVGEGGMIGYLLSGSTSDFFEELLKRIQPLKGVPGFSLDIHRASQHERATAPRLRLHHMSMACA
jgi:hypothetical protein